jgi:hypothetical protein
VLVAKGKLTPERAVEGKQILVEIVSMTAGLIARFSRSANVEEDRGPAALSIPCGEKE